MSDENAQVGADDWPAGMDEPIDPTFDDADAMGSADGDMDEDTASGGAPEP